ncbi:hypothetical protein [Xanthomonas albilineans]|uniref:hypothetical protein n=1 Tax=Xanthomonas albilineans TaxID=29447 RepID=UPI0005F3362E|nr:hypothetical protein [Xanthomonas albilineans]
MATYTREELVRNVLLELGILDPNEAPRAEDYVCVDKKIQTTFEELDDEGLIPFLIEGPIPARYMGALTYIVARELVNQFGALSRAQLLEQRAQEGYGRLWKLREKSISDQPVKATYY